MKLTSSEEGFSLIEVTIGLAVMTTIMGMAFMLLNNFQLAYQREDAYADAARNARFAVSRLEEISRRSGQEVWIKNDGLYGTLYGGNKPRKLELVLPRALATGAPTIMTTGPNWGGIDGLKKLKLLADKKQRRDGTRLGAFLVCAEFD